MLWELNVYDQISLDDFFCCLWLFRCYESEILWRVRSAHRSWWKSPLILVHRTKKTSLRSSWRFVSNIIISVNDVKYLDIRFELVKSFFALTLGWYWWLNGFQHHCFQTRDFKRPQKTWDGRTQRSASQRHVHADGARDVLLDPRYPYMLKSSSLAVLMIHF